MADEIKLDYGLADEMIATFKQAEQQLNDTLSEVQAIAITLEDGALLGRAGEAFTDGIRGKLSPAIARLSKKMEEMAKDVEHYKRLMQGTDRSAARTF